jgi:hypothetical protein
MQRGVLFAAFMGLVIAGGAMGGDKPACTLTAADKAANALLSLMTISTRKARGLRAGGHST